MSESTSAWRAVAGATLLDFAVSPLFIWDTFTRSLSRDLQVPETGLSLVFSVSLATFSAGVVGGGRVADAVAPRRLAALTGAGVVTGLGTAAVAPSLPVLLGGFGVVLGAATGLGYATAVRVAGTAAAQRGRAVAIVVSAYAAGAVVLAPVAAALLAEIGRAGAFTALAVLLGAALAGAAALLPGAAHLSSRQPAERAAQPSGRSAMSAPVPALWTMFLLGSAPALIAFGHAGELAGAPGRAVVAVALLNAGNFGGRLLAGPAADRVGHVPALHVTAVALGGACVVLALSDHRVVTLGALLVLGTQYGALSVLTPVATAASVPSERFGATFGTVFSGWGVAGLAGPVAAAWLATRTGYDGVTTALVAVAALAWLATAWAQAAVRRT